MTHRRRRNFWRFLLGWPPLPEPQPTRIGYAPGVEAMLADANEARRAAFPGTLAIERLAADGHVRIVDSPAKMAAAFGLPVELDPDLPRDVVVFRHPDGRVALPLRVTTQEARR